MPIYEYRAKSAGKCNLCKVKFEMRQAITDKPITTCPGCGREVERIFSKSNIAIVDSLSQKETFATHTEEQADKMGLEGGFAEDEVWD